jgi:hypothetical protein
MRPKYPLSCRAARRIREGFEMLVEAFLMESLIGLDKLFDEGEAA